MPDENFVTIAQAADALGIDARQVRRYLSRLDPRDKGQDTQRTHKGQPIVLVRLSAVEALRSGETRGEAKGHGARDAQGTVRSVSDAGPSSASGDLVTELRARLADKDAENARLWEALQRSQENERAALLQIAELRREQSVMFAAVASGRATLPAKDTGQDSKGQSDPYENTDAVTTSATESIPAGREVETPVPAQEAVTEPKGEAVRRPWWRLW